MEKVTKRHNFRMLIDQSTGLVVWLSYKVVQPPIVCTTLNYHLFNGETDVDIYSMYSEYRLYYDTYTKLFSVQDTLANFDDLFLPVQLLRAKAIAVGHTMNIVKTRYDRLDLSNRELYLSLSTVKDESSPWIQVYQTQYKCSKADALKLIKFQCAEFETAMFSTESELLNVKNLIKSADTLKEVAEGYGIFCYKMVVNPWDLVNLSTIKRPR